ncbi:MAG: D-alanine--D-alanine ligase [Desulfobacteraceae bacterium]|nr:MAG: D-alanine--D-alanine ligase [Desulfobacteraceae bacterium]
MKKINVAILFGGKSAEHEVSLQSAKNVFDAIDKKKYNPILIGIDKTGRWLLNEQSNFLINEDNPKLIGLNRSANLVTFAPESNGQISDIANYQDYGSIDVAFPILHGPMGEDGTVQGLLKLANIPFVGSSVLGSAVGMDKDVMKRLLREAEIPIARFWTLNSEGEIPEFETVARTLGVPFFIKPANMGSSVGVNKVHNEAGYIKAVETAFAFDLKVIIEEYIEGREIECSVLGNKKPIASILGEIKSSHEFYSYEAKYIDEKGAVLEIPANLQSEVTERAQAIAVKTFKVLCCEGLGRVDMFLKSNGEILVNEINTIPGFTRISMYPKLWEASGIPYDELIDRLIQLAMERFENEKRLKTNYF